MVVPYHRRRGSASAKAGRGNKRIFRTLMLCPLDAGLSRTPIFASNRFSVTGRVCAKNAHSIMGSLLFAAVRPSNVLSVNSNKVPAIGNSPAPLLAGTTRIGGTCIEVESRGGHIVPDNGRDTGQV